MKKHVSREHYSSSELPVGKYVGTVQPSQALLKIHAVVHILYAKSSESRIFIVSLLRLSPQIKNSNLDK